MSADEIHRWVTIEGALHVEEALAQGHGAILLTAHLGNWEICGTAMGLSGYPTTAIARPRTRVRRGQIIGLSGTTGLSRGPHLHFVMFVDGKPIDAAPLLRPAPTYNGGRYGCVLAEHPELAAADGSHPAP
jgi:hypothetical protein